MKAKTILKCALLAAVLVSTSCSVVKTEQDDYYNIPRSAALVATVAYLEKHPESIDTFSKVADKLALLVESPVIPIEDAIAGISNVVQESSIKNKATCIAMLKSLFAEYSVTAITVEDYKFILKEISDGIIEAIDLYIFQHPTYE